MPSKEPSSRLARRRGKSDGSCEGEKFSNWGGRRRGWSSGVVAGEKDLKTWGTFCRGGDAGCPVEGAVRRRKENGHQRGRGFNGEVRGTGE